MQNYILIDKYNSSRRVIHFLPYGSFQIPLPEREAGPLRISPGTLTGSGRAPPGAAVPPRSGLGLVTKNVMARKVRGAGNSAWQRFASQKGESGAAGRVRTAATGLRVELSKPRCSAALAVRRSAELCSAAAPVPCFGLCPRPDSAAPRGPLRWAGARLLRGEGCFKNCLKHPRSYSPISVTAGRTIPLTIRCDTAPFQFRLLYRRSLRLHPKAEQGKEKMRSSGMRAK